jgi:hypothetical protein
MARAAQRVARQLAHPVPIEVGEFGFRVRRDARQAVGRIVDENLNFDFIDQSRSVRVLHGPSNSRNYNQPNRRADAIVTASAPAKPFEQALTRGTISRGMRRGNGRREFATIRLRKRR